MTAVLAVIAADNRIKIPVLMYHVIDEKAGTLSNLYVKTSEFERQMQYLSEQGYTPVHFAAPGAYEGIKKPVIITFDDGYEDNYTNAYPILEEYGFKATIFIITAKIGKPEHLNTEQIKEMSDLIEFGSHTVNHNKLSALTLGQIRGELAFSQKTLEKLTGKTVRTLAYPYGAYDRRVVDIARKYYDFAVTTVGGVYTEGSDRVKISRVYIPRSFTINNFAARLNAVSSGK